MVAAKALKRWLMRIEEGAIRTSGEGVSIRNAEHGMINYIQRESGNGRTWMMGIVGMEERPCITLKAGRRRWSLDLNDGRRAVLRICEWGRDGREPGT